MQRRTVLGTAIAGSLTSFIAAAQAKVKTPLPAMKVSSKRRVLIQSSSRYHHSGYLDFCGDQYEKLFNGQKPTLLFIPYAKVSGSYDGYEEQVQKAFTAYGHKVVSIHRFSDPIKAVKEAQAIAVGGGNTWALVTRMYEAGIIDVIRERVNSGELPYCGWSAGGNVCCPTLRTTNDMPIAEPPSFNTFGFIPFQTNPHFIAASGNQGLNNETREDRLEEFLYYNPDEEVMGLPEGTALYVTGEHDCEVMGPKDAESLYWFRQQPKPMTVERIALGSKFNLRHIVPGGKI